MIYVFVGLITSVLAIVPTMLNNRSIVLGLGVGSRRINVKKLVQYSICVFLASVYIFIAGVRYFVGTDYSTYVQYQIPNVLGFIHDPSHSVEYLYGKLIELGAALGSYQWIFVFTHVIIISFVFAYIWNRSIDYSISIYIFMFGTFFNFSLNGMRQSIATAIFLYASKFIIEHKPIKYTVFILIAALFHSSAYLYLPFYLLRFLHIKKLWPYSVGLLILSPIILGLQQQFHNLLFWVTTRIGLYSKFFGSVYDSTGMFRGFLIRCLIINLVLMFIVTFLYQKSDYVFTPGGLNNASSFQFDLNVQLVATVFSVLSFAIPGSFRVVYMFMPIQMTFVPELLRGIKNQRLRWVVTIGLIVLYAYFFYNVILSRNYNQTLPYQTIFSIK